MLHHFLRLGHTVVVEHLSRQGDAGYRCLQLVSHVVDEVVLHLAVTLLAEHHHDGEHKGDKQYQGKHHTGYHEPHARINIAIDVREMHLHHAHLRSRIVAEEHLRIGKLHALVGIVGTTVHLATVLCGNREMVRNVDTIIHQFRLQVLIEYLEVNSLFQRLFRCRIKHIHHHLVEQRLLVHIAVLHYFLKRFARCVVRVAIVLQNHGLGHLRGLRGDGFQLEGRIHRTILALHRKLMRALHGAIVGIARPCAHAIHPIGMPLGLVHILLQIAQRLIELQVARRLVEGAVHAFVELLLLHVGHFLYVRQLQSKQYDEAQAHDNGDDPNGFLLHKGKDKDFLNALTSFC